MSRALSLVAAGTLIAITGVSLIHPPTAVILLGLAVILSGLLLFDIKGPKT
jgi:hypothetical protein